MEISTFVRYRPSWGGIVTALLIALIAAGAAGYVRYREPVTYRGRAITFVSLVAGADLPDYVLGPIADNYEAELKLPAVAHATARATDISREEVSDELRSSRVGESANVRVTYLSTDRDLATDVARVAARTALTSLADRYLERAGDAVGAARSDYEQDSSALEQYEQANGADGSSQHAALEAQRDASRVALDEVLADVATAELQLANATRPSLVSSLTSKEVSRTAEIVRYAVTAFVVSLMLASIVLLLTSGRRPRRIRWRAAKVAKSRGVAGSRGRGVLPPSNRTSAAPATEPGLPALES